MRLAGGPSARAGHSGSVMNGRLYIFGGHDEENNRLDDLWELDLTSEVWTKLEIPDGHMKPEARSGHTTVDVGNKSFVFGGIHEITKELNELLVFDSTTKRFANIE